jgi:hypothetical protein
MKKTILVICAVVLLAISVVWATTISGNISRQPAVGYASHLSVVLSGETTKQVLPAVTGQQIQVFAIVLSSDTATTVTLRSGNSTIVPLAMGNSGGLFEQSSNMELPLFACEADANLNVTLSAAPTTAGIYVIYRYR